MKEWFVGAGKIRPCAHAQRYRRLVARFVRSGRECGQALLAPLLACASFAFAAEAKGEKFGALATGTVVPDFVAVDGEGREAKLADFKECVVVVNFFSTNRPPSDVLASAYAKYGEFGVTVLGICSQATREEFTTWPGKRKAAATYPIAWDAAGKNRDESVALKIFGLAAFPATAVINREGKLVGGFIGFGPAAAPVLRELLRDAGAAIPPEERPARPAAPPPRENRTLKPGALAPDFSMIDGDGAERKLGVNLSP